MSDDWGVFGGGAEILPDSFLGIEARNSCKVSSFPQEQGGFASYNKVENPNEVTVTLAIGGESDIRADFLNELFFGLKSIDTFTIVTPDETYDNMTMEHYSYRRSAESGVSMIIAELRFKEIRMVPGDTTTTPKAASGASATNSGMLTPIGDDRI